MTVRRPRRTNETRSLDHHFIERYGVRTGWVCCGRHLPHQVEIESFGLIPEMVGRGFGGFALTLVVGDAWTVINAGNSNGTGLVWFTTTSWDHAHAANNY